ncbi:MAG: hypothetical protein HOM68_11505 [Gemmatimonadetes bacterium]|jgi:hypothetical protein|nr:hypothetical protein [Gemmatimonadota bacterium]MBT5145966.1 hypothetical protein [Gemmatimonadota bacterium]MBT5588189.1 hypothetical protein [Gemmatimonadota bacterium]MBT5961630.1 hypothetical protein [Gemmatimonadota bacterium]MBT7455056.1 hypothetical protein [Gemmatimonadota bacterium]
MTIHIGNRREPFVDRFLIDELGPGAVHRLHHPRREGVALPFDQPWEGGLALHVTILQDGDLYRMYYRGWGIDPSRPANEEGQNLPVTCYAESRDGYAWHKPNLGLCEWHGSSANNIILTGPREVTQRFSPMLDDRPGVSSSERFKAIGGNQRTGLHLWTSADGLHWSEQPGTVIEGDGFDSQNTIHWNPTENRYVCLFRSFKDVDGERVRWISRTMSEDLVHWSAAEELDFGTAPPEHLYTNQAAPYVHAPHILIGTPARFLPGRWALSPQQEEEIGLHTPETYEGLPGALSDTVLITSRGGTHVDRTFMEAFVRPGEDANDWVARSNYPALGILPTSDRELSLYVARHYGQPTAYLERLSLRVDGFASLSAGFDGGEIITKAFTFEGSQLRLNMSTSAAGSVRVEVQDADGHTLPGYEIESCDELIGDEVDRRVTWGEHRDVASLAGKPVRLRFQLRDADLFALQFD